MIGRFLNMQAAVSLLAVVLVWVPAAGAGKSGPGDVRFEKVSLPDGRTAVRASFHVQGDRALVYETLRDAEKFPEFMPNTREVTVLDTGAGFQIVNFRGGTGVFKTDITLKRSCDAQQHRISWSLVAGQPKSCDGFWQVLPAPEGAGATVVYENTLDLHLLIPDVLVRSFLKKSLRKTAERLQKRVRSNGVWISKEYRTRHGQAHQDAAGRPAAVTAFSPTRR